jgi:hypothetical protein
MQKQFAASLALKADCLLSKRLLGILRGISEFEPHKLVAYSSLRRYENAEAILQLA